MKRYRVQAEVTIALTTVVVAKSKKEAKALAEEAPMITLCRQCASGDETTEWVTSGSLDGDIENLTAEEEESQ